MHGVYGATSKEKRPQVARRINRFAMMYHYLILFGIGIFIIFYGGTFGIFFFLIVMGGGVAYLGDQLGIYFGKKRISFRGLRPKHTAILISVTTGMAITFLTLLLTSYLNENFSIAMHGVEELNQERMGLVKHNRELRGHNDTIRKQSDLLVKTNQHLEARSLLLKHEKAALERKVQETETKLRKKIVQAEVTLAKLRKDESKKIKQINRLSRVVEAKETSLIVLNKGQALLDVPVLLNLSAKRQKVGVLLNRVVQDLRQRASLLGVDFDLDRFNKVADRILTQVFEKMKHIRSFYTQRNAKDPSRFVPSQCYLQVRSTKNVSVGEELHSIRFDVKPNMLIFRKNEEVARTPIDGKLDEVKILEQLFYFDKQVIAVLREKGVAKVSLRRRVRAIPAAQLIHFYRIARLLHRLRNVLMVRFVVSSDVYTYGDIDAVYKVEGISEDLEEQLKKERMMTRGEPQPPATTEPSGTSN